MTPRCRRQSFGVGVHSPPIPSTTHRRAEKSRVWNGASKAFESRRPCRRFQNEAVVNGRCALDPATLGCGFGHFELCSPNVFEGACVESDLLVMRRCPRIDSASGVLGIFTELSMRILRMQVRNPFRKPSPVVRRILLHFSATRAKDAQRRNLQAHSSLSLPRNQCTGV